MTTAYDEVAYPTQAFRQTHPDRLAAIAMLFGLTPAPLKTCRVLDIGCGDGGNSIPMALTYPAARFVGFDLADAAIQRGRAVVDALGLTNIELKTADILDPQLSEAPFDYIIAHGVYSWVPDFVREAMMALIGACLAPNGVAFVSYNALPGCRARQVVRDMLHFHVRHIEGAHPRALAAQAKLAQIAEEFPETSPFNRMVKAEAKELSARELGVLAHDEMGDCYNPVHLHEFVADAERHGLQFLSEAESSRSGEGFRPPHALDDEAFDVIAHAQEMDFGLGRPFRQSLVVRANATFSRRPEPGRLLAMHASCAGRPDGEGRFQVGATAFEINDPKLAEVAARLGGVWPATLPVRDLVDDDAHLAALLRMFWTQLIDLHPGPPPYSTAVSDRPETSPLARLQVAQGVTWLTTLRHGVVNIEDDFGRGFIGGLDGTRTRAEIRRDVAAAFGKSEDEIAADIDTNLKGVAHLPLLWR